MTDWPIHLKDVLRAKHLISQTLQKTPLRRYPILEALLGHDIKLWLKHENTQPTGAFKVRNAINALSTLPKPSPGIVAATRGNHGQGLAWVGKKLNIPVTLCVPVGNNIEKNEAMKGFGATLIEDGNDYDESIEIAKDLVAKKGLHMVHSTNDPSILAGAATITWEILEQNPNIDALIVSVGGGSQAVGALTVARALRPDLLVYGVQAQGARAIHDSWHAKKPLKGYQANTIADGLATRHTYSLTFPALQAGLTDFVTVTDQEIAEAVRVLLRTTHHLIEGAGASTLAALLFRLRKTLEGKTVALILSGGNLDQDTLRQIVCHEL